MNFIPLAIWAVGFLAVVNYEHRSLLQVGLSLEEVDRKTTAVTTKAYVIGCGIFFIIGLVTEVFS